MSTGLDRRALLVTAAAVGGLGTLAGCTSAAGPAPTTAISSPGPVDAVATDEAALVGQYDAAIAAYPALADSLAVLRQHHVEHAAALSSTALVPVPATAAPTIDGVLAALIAAERDASRARIDACVDETDPARARTLAFIAASESSHVPYLRDLRA